MRRTIPYQITKADEKKTIGQFLKERGYSHPVLVQLKKTTNGILHNHKWAYVTEVLYAGDSLTITIEENIFDSHIAPVQLPVEICYEDEDLLVINKPAGMPIHPSMKNHDNTLANALMYYFHTQNIPFTFRCMNRLDRDTTGLTIVAKHALSAAVLNRQITQRSIHRTYLAICRGLVPESGTIDAPIARADSSTIERCVDFTRGEAAVTHFKRTAYQDDLDLSLVSLSLETGRTHQIRVHMKYIGHPLIGDFLYHPDMRYIHRQALHSSELEFMHPVTNQKMHFHTQLPPDMKCIFPV